MTRHASLLTGPRRQRTIARKSPGPSPKDAAAEAPPTSLPQIGMEHGMTRSSFSD